MKLELCRKIFNKYSFMEFHEHLTSDSRLVPCWETDGGTGAILKTHLKLLSAATFFFRNVLPSRLLSKCLNITLQVLQFCLLQYFVVFVKEREGKGGHEKSQASRSPRRPFHVGSVVEQFVCGQVYLPPFPLSVSFQQCSTLSQSCIADVM